MLESLVPILICDDVPASIRFYTEVLGFEVKDRMDDVGRSGWAFLRHGRVELMLASPHGVPHAARVDGRHPQAAHYIYTVDAVALHRSVQARGWPAGDLQVRFYGMKEFEVIDPSGHVLVFGQHTDERPASGAHHE